MTPPNPRNPVLSPFALKPLRHAILAGLCLLSLSGCNLIPPAEMIPPAPLQPPSTPTDKSTGALAQAGTNAHRVAPPISGAAKAQGQR